ncbi:hypothetical protein FGE12_22985 [Aggregicoccus sp. 17bor-14]|uniref:hypothetical protein n=1 Tax=Myxococcaceae TaxID=31 RepID=UPI00129D18EE|nr:MULTISPECIES: hypothetical protein [Myxococcaceae]MBF5045289.1 hypothetical protein [Simulacricoccus sp. 17bor-14]MRI91030.1 hypothetical protein [Aggregicoccus sp. 17bor-14]
MSSITIVLALLLVPMLIGLCTHALAGLLGFGQQLAGLFGAAPRRRAHPVRTARRASLLAAQQRVAQGLPPHRAPERLAIPEPTVGLPSDAPAR